MKRRRFIKAFVAGTLLPFVAPVLVKLMGSERLRRFLRPPGALPEKDFLRACIGCSQCANVCPNKCITMQGTDGDLNSVNTPVIIARRQACILCMACTQVCPTDALEPIEPTEEGKLAVDMGKAFVSEDICYSFAGRTCGVCFRACPLPGKALKLGLYEQPHVNHKFCVGCGLCESACVHMPQAIRVIPKDEVEERNLVHREDA